jgi:hypothetical protein
MLKRKVTYVHQVKTIVPSKLGLPFDGFGVGICSSSVIGILFFRFCFLINVYVVVSLFNTVIYVFLLLCLIVYLCIYCMFMYFHRASWHSSGTLTEVSPCFFLSCKANARVKPVKMGHGPHS